MQRTNIVELKPSKNQEKILKECLVLSSCVYNSANYIVRHQFFNKEKVSNFIDLRVKLQKSDDYVLLGRSYALPRLQVYSETNSARFKLVESKSQSEVGLPKYYKNRKTNTTLPSYLVMDNSQYSLSKTKATIPLSRAMRKKYSIKSFKIDYNGVLKWSGKQQRGQIHFKNGKFYLYQSVEIDTPKIKQTGVSAGIDLGIKNLFAIHLSTGEDKIIGRTRHYRQWTHYTQLIAKEQSELSKQNKRTSKKLSKLFALRTRWQENLYKNLTSSAFRFLNKHNVDTLYVGDVTGIRENKDWGHKGNRMLHNYWTYDMLYKLITNHCESDGINLSIDEESYTSSTCPVCGDVDRNYKKDRIFLCKMCDHFGHRDLIGAENILFNGMHSHQSVHSSETAHLVGGC